MRQSGWVRSLGAASVALVAVGGAALVGIPEAGADIQTSVWTGGALSSDWSAPGNWNLVPEQYSPLSFPALPAGCSISAPPSTCYVSFNNLGPLDIPSVTIFGGSSYFIGGDPIALGAGGISDAGPTSYAYGDTVLGLPVQLSAPQTWSISGTDGEHLVDTGGVTDPGGPTPLVLDLTGAGPAEGGPTITLRADNEVGPVTVTGADDALTGASAAQNGTLQLRDGGSLNAADDDTVSVSDAGIGGSGAVGPLTTHGADVTVGGASVAPGTLSVASADLDPASQVNFSLHQFGATPGLDYSQLTSSGAVNLGDSHLSVEAGTSSSSCFTPPLGQTYTLVSTEGLLSGTFSDATGPLANGAVTSLAVPSGCAPSPYELQIAYDTTSSPATATATVVAPTTTVVRATPATTSLGGAVTYGATVAGPAGVGASPTGDVVFTVGSTTLCTAQLSDGSGSCTADDAPPGPDVVTGTYAGSNQFLGSSGQTSLQVSTPTDTAVTVDPSTTQVGSTVTYRAAVTPASGSGTPVGIVTFTTGTTTLCTTPPLVGGVGTCTATDAPVGSDQVTGSFSGSPDWGDSSGTTTLTVTPPAPVPTETTVNVSPSSVTEGDQVTYSASVAPTTGSGTPTGTVAFTIGGSNLCTATLSGGTGSCTSSAAPPGDDTVTGTYSGDDVYAVSSGTAALTVTVAPEPSTTAVSVAPASVVSGAAVTYSAVVAPASGSGVPTGTVTFTTGLTPLCTATLSGGSGSCTSSAAPIGTDTVTGAYSGDDTFAPSDGTTTLTVTAAVLTPTTTSISASPASVVSGTAVTYSAAVAPASGSGVPTGTVTFTTGLTPLCTATLSGGSGSCTSSAAPVGTDLVTGAYSGDTSFAPSDATTTVIVTPPAGAAPTTTTVTVSPDWVDVGQSVTYSATVAPVSGTGTPTGTVAFTIAGSPVCTATLAGGTGSCTSTNAPVGPDTVVGAYSGDLNFAQSQGSAELLVMTPNNGTTTTITVSPSTVTFGQTVTYSATVAPVAGTGSPTGTVTMTTESGSEFLCTVTLTSTSGGTGTCTADDAHVGDDTITGTYSGDTVYSGSQGTTTLTVNPPASATPTTTVISATPDVAPPGTTIRYAATVTPTVGAGTPTGTVTFDTNAGTLCVATLFDGSGSCSSSDAPIGTDRVVGVYSGDETFAQSEAAITVFIGTLPSTTTAVRVDPGAILAGKEVTYAATVSPSAGGGTPTGTVAFSADGTALCTATLTGGAGACLSNAAPTGTDTVTGAYSGDGTFAPSTGTTTLVVNPSDGGYWEVASDGGLFAFGDAGYYGSMGGRPLNKPIVGMAATPDGKGYWEVASDGGLFAFGDAGFYGSMGGRPLNKPVVGMAATPDGRGYWLVASDGGLFAFGDAGYYGSTGNLTLNKPVVGMTATTDGHGYWLVASDGGLFAFGDGGFFGSTGNLTLNKPVVGMAGTLTGTGGYWLVASDGGLFAFGNAGFFGSMGGKPLVRPVVGMAAG